MWVNGHASLYLKVWHVTLPGTDDFLWRLVNWHLLLCRLIHSPSVRWILITWIMVIHCVYIFYMPLVDYGFWFNLIYFVLFVELNHMNYEVKKTFEVVLTIWNAHKMAKSKFSSTVYYLILCFCPFVGCQNNYYFFFFFFFIWYFCFGTFVGCLKHCYFIYLYFISPYFISWFFFPL